MIEFTDPDNRRLKYTARHGFGRHYTHSIFGFSAATIATVASTAISAGSAIAGAVGGGGGGAGGQRQTAIENFNREMSRWNEMWTPARIARLNKAQRQQFRKTREMLTRYKGLFNANFDEKTQEKIHREFVGEVNQLSGDVYKEMRGDIEQLGRGELDPRFAQRVTEAEHEINRASADSLNQLVERNARERARGGAGFLNPERRDEMVAGAYARSRDEARANARSQVEQTLSTLLGHKQTAGQSMINQKTGLIDDYLGLGQSQRERETGRLAAGFGFEGQQIRNKYANQVYRDMLDMQRLQSRPTFVDPGYQQQGPSTGQQIADVGGSVMDLVNQFYTPSRPGDPGGQVGGWWGAPG